MSEKRMGIFLTHTVSQSCHVPETDCCVVLVGRIAQTILKSALN